MRIFALSFTALASAVAFIGLISLPGDASISNIASAKVNGPVVLELFTSQGCSSCPPADVVAAKLAKDPNYIVISRPVTYWDRLGWKDTLAREANTDLQRKYSRHGFERAGVYTPQAVLDGREGVVGSRERDIRAIAADLPAKRGAAIATRKQDDGSYKIGLGGSTNKPAELMLLAITPEANVAIGRGENGGHSLGYTNVVRDESLLTRWDGGKRALTVAPSDLATSGPKSGAQRHLLLLRQSNGGPILAAKWL